ncbi:meiotically up-regulated 190 protein [Coprinopsis cinerea okayama7|uniref:Meiotically up-regulated 190 protein n=1 Tax=Coprinopsis cinerea (strain Okayama-7 / 130 / ATCC MYA-4618 / FGSC 9003) TaxID=240176 RepID=D6RK01_COPC7|nr:meiotically up-regulated 190 protein [Coprinopsis cinerea okayama7\|eukprot:XP_002912091.1 meiotically up-regulated 190 protein [Coprinopsis cinerea okayama7\
MTKQHDDRDREVTDPVTHLPVRIHDATDVELERIPPPPSLTEDRKEKQRRDIRLPRLEEKTLGDIVNEMTENDNFWWDDPLGDQNRTRVQTAIIAAAAAGFGGLAGLFVYRFLGLLFGHAGFLVHTFSAIVGSTLLAVAVGCCALSFHTLQDKKPRRPDKASKHPKADPFHSIHAFGKSKGFSSHPDSDPESAIWLNGFLKSVWPLINPGLFTAVCDMLEDSLQASLPAMIHGVKVAELGQGSEPVRILGIRCLDKGAAATATGDGMEGEEGDFVNMEVAVGYRAKDTSGLKGLRARAANLHILMEFWLSGGGLKLPVWVELEGLLAIARFRIQLMSTPPFLSLMTMTLLGQPKLKMKCTPLKRGLLNVMDIPGLSGWLQSTIDATIKDMLVAPRSMNVDLKASLMGEMEKDTAAIGVLVVTVRKAILKFNGNEKHDAYVTVGWSKLGKPMWSTRIISDSIVPVWEETTFLLVGSNEVDIQEGLRLQVWDSDRFTADDLMGNVDVPLHDIMHNHATRNHVSRREDHLVTDKGQPTKGDCRILWECGYYEKTSLDDYRSEEAIERIRSDVHRKAEAKLREAIGAVDIEHEQQEESEDKDILMEEIEQQKEEDMKARSDESWDWRCRTLGRVVSKALKTSRVMHVGTRTTCLAHTASVIIHQRKVYQTRTKMKDDNPYFGASTEKFIRDWRTTTVIIAVRDNRQHENDPLLGVVVLPLRDLFRRNHSSMFVQTVPITGGIGYGKMKLALLFRSVRLPLPKRLRGWDVGTVEVYSGAKVEMKQGQGGGKVLEGCKMTFRIGAGEGANVGNSKGKMVPLHESDKGHHRHLHYHHEGEVEWISRSNRPVRLPVKNRYASSVLVEFKKSTTTVDQTMAFGTVWLKDVPDDEEVDLVVPIYSYRLRSGSMSSEKQGVKYAKMNAAAPKDSRVKGGQNLNLEEEGSVTYEGDGGESIGHVRLRLCFHSGLSGYHKSLSGKDKAMVDVMQVLDCVMASPHGAGAAAQGVGDRGSMSVASSISDSEGSSEDDDEYIERHSMGSVVDAESTTSGKSKSGIVENFKQFKKHQGDLNRRHRGLMQWKAARNVAWIGKTVEEKSSAVGGRILRPFVGHRERQIGIDTEV